ncbi:MAG: type II toxin-antitoxin system RelE/ParE family toxin [Phycisphaerae bacterium]
MAYRIEYMPAATRALRRLDKTIQRRIVARIEHLSGNPRPFGAVKLSGHDTFRIRIGDYRVIYAIVDERMVVLVVETGNRREVYRGW